MFRNSTFVHNSHTRLCLTQDSNWEISFQAFNPICTVLLLEKLPNYKTSWKESMVHLSKYSGKKSPSPLPLFQRILILSLSNKKKILKCYRYVPTNSKQIITHKTGFICVKVLSRLLALIWKPDSEIRFRMEYCFPWKKMCIFSLH